MSKPFLTTKQIAANLGVNYFYAITLMKRWGVPRFGHGRYCAEAFRQQKKANGYVDKEYMTANAAAILLGVDSATVANWARKGKIERVGRNRYSISSIESYLATHELRAKYSRAKSDEEKKTSFTSIRLTPYQAQKLKAAAKEKGVSISAMIGYLVENYV